MQNYKTVKDTDSIQSSREIFNNAITSAVSNNSGTAFPTDNLVVGMKCYRSDLGKTYTLTDVTNKTWKEDSKADSADKATKLATARTISLTGKATGSANFDGSANASINVTAVTADSCSGNSATASEVAWTGITGKPSTYTPATHNHDTSYPSTSGSRATGTWGISVTGSAGSVAWDNVTGKPSTYTPASHTHAYLPLTGGTTTGKVNIQSVTLENMPQIKRTDGANFAGIRCENTNGYLGAIGIRGEKNSAIVRVDTSNTSYPVLDSSNYNNYSPTKTGTGATGTWGISISGNAATATKATTCTGNSATASAVPWSGITNIPTSITNGAITSSSLKQNGYIKFSNGLVLEWGQITIDTNISTYLMGLPLTLKNFLNIQVATTVSNSKNFTITSDTSYICVTLDSFPASSGVMYLFVVGTWK